AAPLRDLSSRKSCDGHGPSRFEVAQHASRPPTALDDAALVHRANAVDPDALDTDSGRIEAIGPRRQVVDAAFGTAGDGLGIEQQEIRPRAGDEPAAVLDAIRGRDVARDPFDRFLER